jgi:hypothetical protein
MQENQRLVLTWTSGAVSLKATAAEYRMNLPQLSLPFWHEAAM